MTRSVWLAIGLTVLLVAAAVAIIVYTATRSSGMFRFVNEVVDQRSSLGGRDLWMAGTLEPEGHQYRREPGQPVWHRFYLSHKGQKIQVLLSRALPASVKPGQQLIVHGRLDDQGRFRASTVRTKCPSKYKSRYEAGR